MTIDKLNHAKAIAAEIDMLDEQMRRLGSLLRNEENGANQTYSAEYQKYVGMQMAMREVLEYFSKFEL